MVNPRDIAGERKKKKKKKKKKNLALSTSQSTDTGQPFPWPCHARRLAGQPLENQYFSLWYDSTPLKPSWNSKGPTGLERPQQPRTECDGEGS